LNHRSSCRNYVHQALHQEVSAIGGRYVLVKRARLPFRGREVLYLVGHAAFDSTCCGVGGCAYALVPGFVLRWKEGTDAEGWPVSLVEPVRDEATQRALRRLIQEREVVQQVVFQ
jgi:hypothetical protein